MQPGLVEYKYDEAHITSLALSVVQNGSHPLLSGGTTLGISRSAFDVYLLALPLAALAQRPEAAVWFLGSLGVLAVALTYVLGRRIGGERVALLCGLYMAGDPWLVVYDRKLWAHIQVVLSVALVLVAWEVVVAGRRRLSFLFPILAALQVLSHVLALLQVLSWLGGFLVAPRRWTQRFTVAGLFVALLLMAPYVWGLATSGGIAADLNGGPGVLGNRPVAAAGGSERWLFARQVLGGAGISSLVGAPADATPLWRAGDLLSWLVLLMTAIGVLRVAGWLRNPRRRAGGGLLLAWTVGPLLALLLGPIRVYPQYWTALLPLPALFFALGTDGLARRLSQLLLRRQGSTQQQNWSQAVVAMVAVILLVAWVGGYAAMVQALDSGAGAQASGISLKRWQSTLAATREWAQRLDMDQVKVVVRGVDPGQESEPAAVASLIGSPPYARFLTPSSPAPLLLSDAGESLYLWTLDAPAAESRLAELGDMVWQGELALGLPAARLYRVPPAGSAHLDFTPLDPPATFDAGLQLLGYAFPVRPLTPQAGATGPASQENQPVEVSLVWHIQDPPAEVRTLDFTAFNHVLDANGQRVAQSDGLALLSRDWWPGDVLVQPYSVDLPPGAYTWRVGLYSRVDGRRAQVVGGGDAVDLGPLIVP